MSQADPSEQVLARLESTAAREALRGWLRAHSATLVPENWTGKGYTTAPLLGAQLLRYRADPVIVILKINPSGGGLREYNAHLRAVADSPLARDHLAKPVTEYIPVPEGGSIFLQSPANGGLDETSQLDAALQTYRAPEELCRKITTSLLENWNTGSDLAVKSDPLGVVVAAGW